MTLLKQSTNQGVRFLVYNETKEITHKYIPVKFLADFIAGGLAGACSVIANNPIDVVKTNMQGLETDKFKGNWGCIKNIFNKEGVFGFYKGVAPRMARVVLDVSLTFSLWQTVIRFFTWVQGKVHKS